MKLVLGQVRQLLVTTFGYVLPFERRPRLVILVDESVQNFFPEKLAIYSGLSK
jgi:hypothetical protein